MPSQTTDTTENGATQLAAIEQRYELAKRRIAAVAVPARNLGPEHDTVTVDVRLTQALIPLRTTPAAEAPQRGRRFWRSLRLPRWVGRSLPAS
jgi:hypothetical protein